MSKIRIQESWTTRGSDGKILDFGLKTIIHTESYVEWNDDLKEWISVNIL